MSFSAKAFIALVIAIGAVAIPLGLLRWQCDDWPRFVCYMVLAIIASRLKVKLPGILGTISVNFLFILIGIAEFSLSQTLIIGCVATLTQCLWKMAYGRKVVQIAFNIANMGTASVLAYLVYHQPVLNLAVDGKHALLLVLSASTFFVANTAPVAVVVALTEHKAFRKIWSECYFWCFAYYMVGAAIAGMVGALDKSIGWQPTLLVLPVVYSIYRSYRLYVSRLEDEKKHVEEMAMLHLRTIEALALAIEAKDHTTHDHLCRVRTYALEIGRELGLSEDDLDALRAASLLHDIGKLAVPEHIISKPGRLTLEEFEKMKIHPVVGAEILERVSFPYPVVPIVRSHHEKWDGTGYPDGLKGEEIPIGARILSAVDCFDALASDRQYRRALPLDEAIKVVVADAGKQFDPKVVEVLQRRYLELEQKAKSVPVENIKKLSTDIKVERGAAPAAGFELSASPRMSQGLSKSSFLSSIAAAREEAQTLFELSQDLGNSLSLDVTLSVLVGRLKRLVPYDTVAIYVLKDEKLVPEYVHGENFRLFSSLKIPLGEGLSGWVAETKKPIVNGNPAVEPGYLSDPAKFSTLRSALAVPLHAMDKTVGVLALYHGQKDIFSMDHLRILLAISSKLGMCIENSLKYRMAENSASTDYLTGLPNARSLFLHLDSELARCRRSKEPLAVLVCDLNGFKQINDHFGHPEGNKVLRLVAAGVKETCREYDYVARMGGDEFVIVAPGLSPEALSDKTERLNRVAQTAGFEVCGTQNLSLSVGAAFFPEDGTDADQLIAQADQQMYVAKRDGQGNKLLHWPSTTKPARIC